MILAIDTSTERAGIALLRGSDLAVEMSWNARANHSVQVNALMRRIFELAGIGPSAVTGIVVAKGPGSFNGLRVGISLGKGLAMGLGVPITGISTLDSLAFQASPLWHDVLAVLPAGRGEVFAARYSGEGETWTRTSDYRRLPMGSVSSACAPDTRIAIGGAASLELDLGALPMLWTVQRPGFLAELGKRYFDAGGGDQLDTLEPLYLRLSAAEENRAAQSRG